MKVLIKYIPWLVISYTLFDAYEIYMEHLEKKERMDTRLESIKNKIKSSRKKKRDIEKFNSQISDAKEKIELLAQAIEKSQKKLPDKINDWENIETLRKISTGFNLKQTTLSPGIENNKGFYIEKNYNFEGKGTFLQFLEFFKKVENIERIFNITDLNITKDLTHKKGRFQIVTCVATLKTYRHNTEHREDRGIKSIGQKK